MNLSVAVGRDDSVTKHVLPFKRYFEDDNNLYLLTKYCQHKTLEQLLYERKKLNEFQVSIIMRHLLTGVQYL